jgi:hypothetical protein
VRLLGLTGDERGRAFNWLVEMAGAAGGRAGPFTFAGGIRAMTPLSPVHLRARRQDDGAVVIDWIRRARIGADDWDAVDILLDEPDERYRIDILSGPDDGATAGETLRSTDVAKTSFTYAAADELADFGARQSRLSLSIRQLGRAVPLGIAAATTIDII